MASFPIFTLGIFKYLIPAEKKLEPLHPRRHFIHIFVGLKNYIKKGLHLIPC